MARMRAERKRCVLPFPTFYAGRFSTLLVVAAKAGTHSPGTDCCRTPSQRRTRRHRAWGPPASRGRPASLLQLALQRPELAILDETDSGLDIDALRVVANGVNAVAGPDMGVLIITHYQRILHLVQPSHVHVMYQGRIVKEGGPELVDELEAKGYGWITEGLEAVA